VKQKVTLFIAVTYALKVMTVTVLRRNIIANVQCLLLALRHALKQPLIVVWSMKLCWLLTTFQSDVDSHRRPSLVSDKHVPACRLQSVYPGAGALVWF